MNRPPHPRPAGVFLALALLAPLTPSCKDEPATAITLAISSEASIPREIDAISLEVRRGTKTTFARSYSVDRSTGQARIPGSLTLSLHPDEDSSEPLRISLRADQKGEQVTLRTATTSFVEGKTKLLRITLRYSCFDFPKACGDGQTCLGGKCQSDLVDATRLPDSTPSVELFPGSAQGGCFDGRDEPCAVGRSPIDKAAFLQAGCSLDVGNAQGFAPGKLNVFALWGDQTDQGHPVVLDRDPLEGWSYKEGSVSTFQLADGLCEQLKNGQIERVSYNFACDSKSLSTPLCALDPAASVTPPFDASACHQCAYAPKACEKELSDARNEKDSQKYINDAFACPYDGRYSSPDECEAVRGCFLGMLSPILECAPADCEKKYSKALAWVACLASKNPNPAEGCQACKEENLSICDAPAP